MIPNNNSHEKNLAYTLENCLLAKQELIKQGFTEDNFYYASQDDVEVGLFIGEPIMNSNDDDCITAFELYKSSLWTEEDYENMLDYYIENVWSQTE